MRSGDSSWSLQGSWEGKKADSGKPSDLVFEVALDALREGGNKQSFCVITFGQQKSETNRADYFMCQPQCLSMEKGKIKAPICFPNVILGHSSSNGLQSCQLEP